MKPPPFQMKPRTAAVTSASSHTAPPVWAVSPSPTLIITSTPFRIPGSALTSSKLMNLTSNGAPDSASMTPA